MTRTRTPFDFISPKSYYHPRDKGWSWIVMMAAFGSQFIVIGYQRSFGLLFIAFQEKYGYSSALLSVVNGTQNLVYSFSTMVVMNYLLKKISMRTSCAIGTCLQAVGVVASSLFPDMASLIICQGFFFGLGHSMLYCPTILILSQYFERHRSIATSIATCGAGVGGIAFPYISRFLLNVFGLDGALLVLGALIFNQLVFYLLFQPIVVEASSKLQKPESVPRCSYIIKDENDVQINSSKNLSRMIVKSDDVDKFTEIRNAAINNNMRVNLEYDSNGKSSLLVKDSSHLARFVQLSASQVIKPLGKSEPVRNGKDKLYSSLNELSGRVQLNHGLSNKSHELLSMIGGSINGIHFSFPAIMVDTAQRQRKQGECDQCSSGERDNRIGLEIRPPTVSKGDEDVMSATSIFGENADNYSEENPSKHSWIPAVVRLSAFWLIAIYLIGGFVAAGCPALYIPPLSKEKGLTNSEATFFLTISATTDFIGRIGSGLVLHFKLINPCSLALLPLGLCTVFFNLTPVLNDFYSVLLLTLQYGVSSSMFWTLMSLVIIEVLGLENLGPAMGFYAVICGLTTSASFPFAGWLHDETGSYASSFHYFGSMSFVAALALLLVSLPHYRARCNALKPCRNRDEESTNKLW